MSSHPTADAFMRGYLQKPSDVTARLVFADWLEETGQPWNRAWAYYIRVKAEADGYPPGSPERRELEKDAAWYATKIRARLTISAALFVGYPKSLLQLLPGRNITVKLAGFTPAPDVIELVNPLSPVVYQMFPLARQGSVLLLAIDNFRNCPALDDLKAVLGLTYVAVHAQSVELRAAIQQHYPADFTWPVPPEDVTSPTRQMW